MRAVMRRVGVLAVAGLALALFVAPAAAAAPAEPSNDRLSDAVGACADPCPTAIYFKGNGGGRLDSTPALPDFPCVPPACVVQIPDDQTLGRTTVVLRPVLTTPNSSFLGWDASCPKVLAKGECELTVNALGAQYTLCPTFVINGTAPPPPGCPPTYVPPPAPPPPPPPSGPPALGSPCTIRGSAGGDHIVGTGARDVICGRGGNDIINGRGNHDLILGGGGSDRITGGAGRDHLRGQYGRDTLYARDSTRDTLNGGSGRDRARFDAVDRRLSIERRF